MADALERMYRKRRRDDVVGSEMGIRKELPVVSEAAADSRQAARLTQGHHRHVCA